MRSNLVSFPHCYATSSSSPSRGRRKRIEGGGGALTHCSAFKGSSAYPVCETESASKAKQASRKSWAVPRSARWHLSRSCDHAPHEFRSADGPMSCSMKSSAFLPTFILDAAVAAGSEASSTVMLRASGGLRRPNFSTWLRFSFPPRRNHLPACISRISLGRSRESWDRTPPAPGLRSTSLIF